MPRPIQLLAVSPKQANLQKHMKDVCSDIERAPSTIEVMNGINWLCKLLKKAIETSDMTVGDCHNLQHGL